MSTCSSGALGSALRKGAEGDTFPSSHDPYQGGLDRLGQHLPGETLMVPNWKEATSNKQAPSFGASEIPGSNLVEPGK